MRGSLRRWVIGAMLAAGALCPEHALAQTPARFYWKTLSDANAVPVIVNSISGNTNPFDPAHIVVSTDAQVDATMAVAGYARTFTFFRARRRRRIHRAHGAPLWISLDRG
jgi:hypothetical protein